MTGSNVNSYVAKFEDLCRLAEYTVGSEETVYLFMQGLTKQIQKEVLRPPILTTYYDTKQRAIDAARSVQLIEALAKNKTRGNNPSFQRFRTQFGGNRPFNPFFQPNQQQQNNQAFRGNPRPQYNSSNAPRWMANQPVPMDLSCSRAPVNRNW